MVPNANPAAGIPVSTDTSPRPVTLVRRIGLPGAVMLLAVPEESGISLMSLPTSVTPVPSATVSWPPSKVMMAFGFDPKKPKAATGAALSNVSAATSGVALNCPMPVSFR